MGLLDIFFKKWTDKEILAYLKVQIDLINIDGHADEKEHEAIFNNMKIIKWKLKSQTETNNLSEAKKMSKKDVLFTIKGMSDDKKKIISLGLKTISLADDKLLKSEQEFLVDIAKKTGIPSVIFTKLELAKIEFNENAQVTEPKPKIVEKSSSDFHDNYITVDKMFPLLDGVEKDYEFCKLIFKKLETGSIRNDEELELFILKFLRKHSGDEVISKLVNFQTIESVLGQSLNVFIDNNDTSFKGYIEIEQYHSITTICYQLCNQVMFESIIGGVK